jgi:protein-tyrosine phosphatase
MDDGSPSEEISLEMLRIAAESGTTDIVATPHSNAEYEYRPSLIDERIRHLNEVTGGRPHIHRGCDLHLSFDNIVGAIETPGKFSINGHRYILVECSDLHISGAMDKVLDRLLDADLVPIVTHPERNPILQKDTEKLRGWVNQGCLVQVTALSVMGGFGKRAHAVAHKLLAEGLVHVIASDAHDPVHRHPRLDEAFHAISKQYGEGTADLLFNSNPGSIIEGQFVAGGRVAVAGSGKWWQFWSRS